MTEKVIKEYTDRKIKEIKKETECDERMATGERALALTTKQPW